MENDKMAKEEMAYKVRDTVHNLDLADKESYDMFREHSRRFFAKLEGYYLEAYDDSVNPKNKANLMRNVIASGEETTGNVTVGIGFNMDSGGKQKGRGEWDKVLSTSFDAVYHGKTKLKPEEVDRLFFHSIDIRIKRLQDEYKGSWDKLRPNEQMAILSAYFNGPGTVQSGTKFHKHITAYVATGDTEYLRKAYNELRHNTNKEGDKQERRNAESTLLDSTQCPFYVFGPDKHFLYIKKPVSIEETIIPRGMPCPDSQKFPEFFVWRTQLDSKVRFEHWRREGLIYRMDNVPDNKMPGCDYGCRCWAEPVPDVVSVIENRSIVKTYTPNDFNILALRIRIIELGLICAKRGLREPEQMVWNIIREFKNSYKN